MASIPELTRLLGRSGCQRRTRRRQSRPTPQAMGYPGGRISCAKSAFTQSRNFRIIFYDPLLCGESFVMRAIYAQAP